MKLLDVKRFEPEEDITAHELALIVRATMGTYVYIRRQTTLDLLKGPIGRHFKNEEENDTQKE